MTRKSAVSGMTREGNISHQKMKEVVKKELNKYIKN